MDSKAPNKTTKSLFDIQIDNASKTHKSVRGICFTMRRGNSIEYVNIPNHPYQTFKYFENTSHLTNVERQAIYKKRNEIKVLITKPIIETILEEEFVTDINELI